MSGEKCCVLCYFMYLLFYVTFYETLKTPPKKELQLHSDWLDIDHQPIRMHL